MNYLQNLVLPALFAAAAAYLLGSISFSILWTRLFAQNTDIRTLGSGNAGATNVLRSVGRLPALLTFIFDFLKCIVSVVIGKMIFLQFFHLSAVPSEIIGQYGAYIAGLACVIGHIYPLYFRFKGGKGVVTSIAMIMLIDWRVSLIVWGVFLLLLALFKMVSLSSVCGAVVYPFATFALTFFVDYQAGSTVPLSYVLIATFASLLLGGIIVVKHKENIKRILGGTEKRISFRKRTSPKP